MKKILVIMLSVTILGLLFAGCNEIANITTPGTTQEGFSYIAKGGPTENEADEFPLFAGQSWEVGKVLLWDDGTQICVKYVLDPEVVAEGWGLTETHLAIGASLADIPTNKPGNPQVGHFPYGNDELGGVAEDGPYCVYFGDIGEDGVDCGDTLVIAAHAAIEKTECEVLAEAPYGAFRVVDFLQGLRYDYTPVKVARSVPENALEYETGHSENYFFSLGFHEDREEYLPLDNAWIIVEFEFPIQNGPGDDLQVVEDTWGLPYPDETADVWVSQDGISWEYLGEADNQNPINAYHTVTNFDLDLAGLDWAKFVKVQNTSIRSDFDTYYPGQAATLDGYDLNAVLALHNNEECVTYSQSAWGAVSEGEIRFVGKGNWGTYFTYEIECPSLCIPGSLWIIGDKEDSQLNNPADEFNYDGVSLGVDEPYYDDPFVVGTSLVEDFPWNSNWDRGYAVDFDVDFYYEGPAAKAKLTISWSPGNSDKEQKEVFLDGISIGFTPVRNGVDVSGWYGKYEVFQDTFDINNLTEGDHTLTFKHYLGDGTLWDYVELERICE